MIKEIQMLKGLILTALMLATILYLFNLPIWFDAVAIILFVFPTVYLHLKYSYTDRNKKLIIENSTIFLEIDNAKFDLNSTNKIIIRGSVTLTRNVINILISPNYYNVLFISNEFGEISVSSVVNPDLKSIILDRFDNKIIEYDYFLLY